MEGANKKKLQKLWMKKATKAREAQLLVKAQSGRFAEMNNIKGT
jgi:hypothetical protein